MSVANGPTATFPVSSADLPVELKVELERHCNDFESAWRAGKRLSVDAAVAGLTEPLRSAVYKELRELDDYYLQLLGSKDRGEPASLDFGEFEGLEELGRGAMGVVYLARHKALNKFVALKTILAAGFQSPRGVARLRFEAEAAARLDHPNIVPIYGAGEHQGMPFFSMKYVPGGTLAAALRERRLDVKAAATLLGKVARAVHYAHQCGVIHRDLKPANILLENGEPMVADFGLAKVSDTPGGWSASGAIAGTPSYMAPEQARGDKGLTTAADVYSLGAILYEMLTGRPPFLGATMYEILKQVNEQTPADPQTLNPEAPPDLAAICLKCLEKEAANRYASAADLAADLEAFAEGRSVSVRRRGVLSKITGAISYQNPTPKPKESWVAFTVQTLSVVVVCHSTLFFLIVSGSRMKWVWAALAPYFLFSFVVRVRMLLRSSTYDTWERLTIVISTGWMACIIGLAVSMLPFDPDAPAEAALVWYPPLAALFALGTFVMGGSTMGTYYLASFLYLILGVVLRYSGTAAPLVFLAVHAPMLILLARQATAAHRKPEPADEADADWSAATVSRG